MSEEIFTYEDRKYTIEFAITVRTGSLQFRIAFVPAINASEAIECCQSNMYVQLVSYMSNPYTLQIDNAPTVLLSRYDDEDRFAVDWENHSIRTKCDYQPCMHIVREILQLCADNTLVTFLITQNTRLLSAMLITLLLEKDFDKQTVLPLAICRDNSPIRCVLTADAETAKNKVWMSRREFLIKQRDGECPEYMNVNGASTSLLLPTFNKLNEVAVCARYGDIYLIAVHCDVAHLPVEACWWHECLRYQLDEQLLYILDSGESIRMWLKKTKLDMLLIDNELARSFQFGIPIMDGQGAYDSTGTSAYSHTITKADGGTVKIVSGSKVTAQVAYRIGNEETYIYAEGASPDVHAVEHDITLVAKAMNAQMYARVSSDAKGVMADLVDSDGNLNWDEQAIIKKLLDAAKAGVSICLIATNNLAQRNLRNVVVAMLMNRYSVQPTSLFSTRYIRRDDKTIYSAAVSHLANVTAEISFNAERYNELCTTGRINNVQRSGQEMRYVPVFNYEGNQLWAYEFHAKVAMVFYKPSAEICEKIAVMANTPGIFAISCDETTIVIGPTNDVVYAAGDNNWGCNDSPYCDTYTSAIRRKFFNTADVVKASYMKKYGISIEEWPMESARLQLLFGVSTEEEVISNLPSLM